jgi:hypothetical protein
LLRKPAWSWSGAAFFFCLVALGGRAQSTETWDPQTTWVFAVGVIRFDDPTIPTYPEKGRVDAQLMTAFARRGVPKDHLVFLRDSQATEARIMQRLADTLAQTRPGDTFIFYYTGHGSRDYQDPARPVSFVPYDSATDWPLKGLLDTIEHDFHGHLALLTADCCYSGGLAEEARRHPGPIAFAALTSAQPTSTSTGEWTFTQALTDMLDGNRLLDLNHDGLITLGEAATYINGQMAFCEGQLSSFVTTGGFPANLVMARAQGDPLSAGAGTRCEGLDEGQWQKATILKTEGTRSFVTWVGWDHLEDSWLDADAIRPYVPKTWPVGARVRILWEDQWYPGEVLRNELGLQLVHYDGYDQDDEWVDPARLKPRQTSVFH